MARVANRTTDQKREESLLSLWLHQKGVSRRAWSRRIGISAENVGEYLRRPNLLTFDQAIITAGLIGRSPIDIAAVCFGLKLNPGSGQWQGEHGQQVEQSRAWFETKTDEAP